MKINIYVLILFLLGCSIDSTKNEFRIFEKHKKLNNYESAMKSLNKIIAKSNEKKIIKKAYLEMADLNLEVLKSPESAIHTYKKLSLISDGIDEKNDYKYLVAKIYLENLADYESAINVAKSIKLKQSKIDKKIRVKKILVKAYKNKKNYYQALVEVNSVLNDLSVNNDSNFELKVMKASILSLNSDHAKSNEIYNELIMKYPSKAINEKLYLNVLANYESVGAYDKAIKLLEESKTKYSNNIEFIQTKLKRLKDLKKNMPGAQGLRR